MAGGRPMKYKTVEDLEEAINLYFDRCDDNKKSVLIKDKEGSYLMEIPYPIPYTIEGLAAALDVDRHTINNYSKKEEFFTTIKRAKAKILANLQERGLLGENVAATTIFNLKNNYGYEDKVVQEHSGPGGGPIETKIDVSKLSDDELNALEQITSKFGGDKAGESEEKL